MHIGSGALALNLVRLALDQHGKHVTPREHGVNLDLATIQPALPPPARALQLQAVALPVDRNVVDHENQFRVDHRRWLRVSLFPSWHYSLATDHFLIAALRLSPPFSSRKRLSRSPLHPCHSRRPCQRSRPQMPGPAPRTIPLRWPRYLHLRALLQRACTLIAGQDSPYPPCPPESPCRSESAGTAKYSS